MANARKNARQSATSGEYYRARSLFVHTHTHTQFCKINIAETNIDRLKNVTLHFLYFSRLSLSLPLRVEQFLSRDTCLKQKGCFMCALGKNLSRATTKNYTSVFAATTRRVRGECAKMFPSSKLNFRSPRARFHTCVKSELPRADDIYYDVYIYIFYRRFSRAQERKTQALNADDTHDDALPKNVLFPGGKAGKRQVARIRGLKRDFYSAELSLFLSL